MSLDLPQPSFKNILLVEEVYEQWMKLVNELGSSHSEVAQHLLRVHEKTCEQCSINRLKKNYDGVHDAAMAKCPEVPRTKSRRKPLSVMSRRMAVQLATNFEDSDEYDDEDGDKMFKIEAHDDEISDNVKDAPSTDKPMDLPHFTSVPAPPSAPGPTPLFISKVRPVTPPVGGALFQSGEKNSQESVPDKENTNGTTSDQMPKDYYTDGGELVRIKEEPIDYDEQEHEYESERKDQENESGRKEQEQEYENEQSERRDPTYLPGPGYQEEVMPRMVMFNDSVLNVPGSMEVGGMIMTWTEDDLKKEKQRLKWREERRKQRMQQKEKNTPEQEEERKKRERERMRSYRAKLNPDYKALVRERDRERIKRRRSEMTEEEKLIVRQRNAAQKRIKRKLARMTFGINGEMFSADELPMPYGMFDPANASLNSSASAASLGLNSSANLSLNSSISGMSSAENDSMDSNPSAFQDSQNMTSSSWMDSYNPYQSLPTAFPNMSETSSVSKSFPPVPPGMTDLSAPPAMKGLSRSETKLSSATNLPKTSPSVPPALKDLPIPPAMKHMLETAMSSASSLSKTLPPLMKGPSATTMSRTLSPGSAEVGKSVASLLSGSPSEPSLLPNHETLPASGPAGYPMMPELNAPSFERPMMPQALNSLPVAFPSFVNASQQNTSASTVTKSS